jgi:hypothetical protein
MAHRLVHSEEDVGITLQLYSYRSVLESCIGACVSLKFEVMYLTLSATPAPFLSSLKYQYIFLSFYLHGHNLCIL